MGVRMNTRTAPTDRTLVHLLARGWVADVVEHKRGYATLDFAGCIDVIAMHPTHGVLCVQVTSGSHFANRVAKVLANYNVPVLLAAGCRVHVWAWGSDPEPRVAVFGTLGGKVAVLNENGVAP